MRVLLSLSLLAALSMTACSDTVDIGRVSGNLTVVHAECEAAIANKQTCVVDFGEVQVGIVMPIEIVLKNIGDGNMNVTEIVPAPSFSAAGYEFKIPTTGFALGINQTKALSLTFQPFEDMEAPVESTITFKTDAKDENEIPKTLTINVKGRGITSGLMVIPNPVDFDTVLVGSSRIMDVTITNVLEVPVDVFTRLDDEGRPQIVNQGGLGRFEILSEVGTNGSLNPSGAQLEPNGSITVQARYTPDPAQEGTEDRGRWVIANCANALCDLPVVMIGKGTNAAITCEPAMVDFRDVNPQVVSRQTVICRNVASETVTVTGWRLDTGSATEISVEPYTGDPSSVTPNQEFEVEIAFAPTEASLGRDLTAALVISGRNPRANRDLTPARVPITARAGGPDIDVTPPMVNFGQVAIGTTSKRRILIENVGYSDLTIRDINPDADGTTLFTADRNAGVVASGSSMIVELEFAPVAEGAFTSRMIIASDDTDEREFVVQLQATGVDLPPCNYTVTPEAVNFGIVQVLRPTTQGVRIANVGSNDCLLNDIEITPDSDEAFTLVNGNETGIVLAPGEDKTVLIQYIPHGEGLHMGKLGFYISNPQRSNPEINLRGTGSASALLITPNEINFGAIGLDCSTRARTITVYNTGANTTRISRVELGMGSSNEFELIQSSLPPGLQGTMPAGVNIDPGQSIEFDVRYHARDVGEDTGVLHIWEGTATDPYVVPLFGRGSEDALNEDKFEQLETPEVDILFVIDNSCSMSEEQASLTGNFSSFIQFADAQALDYRIAVVTTDIEGDIFGGTACPNPPVAQRPAGLPQGACGYFSDGNDMTGANPDWRLITPDEQPSPEAAFTAIATQGINGSGTETGLEAAYKALSAPLITGWNTGFLRPDAYFALIFLSDEEDQSSGSVDFYVNFFKAIKGFRNTNLFSASAIVGNSPGGCATADSGQRYISVAQQTGGIFESICTTDWAASLQNLGLSVFGYKSRFFLSNQPIPSTLIVEVDGVRIIERAPSGQVRWSYDANTNSINFAPLAIPEPGSEIVIRYQAECL